MGYFFTEQDDIYPQSGVAIISNSDILNTLAGDDKITGTFTQDASLFNFAGGISNLGSTDVNESGIATINTGDGNDTITGLVSEDFYSIVAVPGIRNVRGIIDTGDGDDIITGIGNYDVGISNEPGTINTGGGDDIITGISKKNYGIDSRNGNITTGDGNDTIMGSGGSGYGILFLSGDIDTGEGNDIITGDGESGIACGTNDFTNVKGRINTGEGDDIITGTGSKHGLGSDYIDTGEGDDIISGTGSESGIGSGYINTGNGDDTISGTASQRGIVNYNTIETGEDNDIITSIGVIDNKGVINTGNGNDSIIAEGTGAGYGIYNNGGAILTGDGNDSIISNEGFESGSNSSGAWFLGEGEDYIKGFGNGDFYGGNGNDTLELTPGTYTVGIWGEGGQSPIFTKGNQLMITSEFEKLKAGGTIYDFKSLTAGQIIVVA
jgi:hypothetical protein